MLELSNERDPEPVAAMTPLMLLSFCQLASSLGGVYRNTMLQQPLPNQCTCNFAVVLENS